MATNQKPLTEQLRNAIVNADITRYRISKKSGVTEAGLSRFVNNVAGLSLDSVDKIGLCLGLAIVTRPTEPDTKKAK